jgi:hypothetical protein
MTDGQGNLDLDMRLGDAVMQLRSQEALVALMSGGEMPHAMTRLLSSSLSEFYRLNALKRRR